MTPPTVTLVSAQPTVFSPDGDRRADRVTVPLPAERAGAAACSSSTASAACRDALPARARTGSTGSARSAARRCPRGRTSARVAAVDPAGNVSERTTAVPIVLRYVALGRYRVDGDRRDAVRDSRLGRRRAGALAARRPRRVGAAGDARAARAAAAGAVHADGHRERLPGACRRVRAGAGALSELARIAGPVGCAGLALLLVATRRDLRLAGLVAWALGTGAARASTWRPDGRTGLLAAAAVGGLVLAAGGAYVLLRWPWVARLRDARLHSRSASRSTSAPRTRTCCCRSTAWSPRSWSRSAGSSLRRRRALARARAGRRAARGGRRLVRAGAALDRRPAAGRDLPGGVRAPLRPARGRVRAAAVAPPLRSPGSTARCSRRRSRTRASGSTSGRRARSSGTRS